MECDVAPRDSRERWLLACGAFGVVFATLISLHPEHMYHWDEYQLVYGVGSFDLTRHQPHPPGYYLFIWLGRLMVQLTGDAEFGLRLLSGAATAAYAACVILLLPRPLSAGTRRWLAACITAFSILSPLLFLYGTVGLTYAADGFLWVLIAALIGRRPSGVGLWLLCFGMGLAGGIRPTLTAWGVSLLVIEALRARGWIEGRDLVKLAGPVALGVASWCVPLVVDAGGIESYRAASAGHVGENIFAKAIFSSPMSEARDRFGTMASDLWLGMGPLLLCVVTIAVLRARSARGDRLRDVDTMGLAGVLAFVFYTVLIYDTDGYMVSAVAPLAAYGFLGVALWSIERPAREQRVALVCLALLIAALPWLAGRAGREGSAYARYSRADATLEARTNAVRERFDPSTTLLVTSNEYWSWGLRHVAHALPGFVTLQLYRDPAFGIASAEAPYLLAHRGELRAVGPDRVDPRALLPDAGSQPIRVVYMVPEDSGSFIDPICAPIGAGLPSGDAERLIVLTPVDPGVDVWIEGERLRCGVR